MTAEISTLEQAWSWDFEAPVEIREPWPGHYEAYIGGEYMFDAHSLQNLEAALEMTWMFRG